MKLADWLKANRVRRTEFADRLGVTRGYVTQLCDGVQPSMSMAERICKATDGGVMPNDFMRLEETSQP
jgi:3,4-dihydroxy 2-butanone 4-phosphate synthase/GTP cyclohydrolase II